MIKCVVRTLAICVVLFGATRCDATLSFNFLDGPGLTALQGSDPTKAQNMRDGFAAAGQLWSARFNDNITINIEMDSAALDPGVLGSAGNATVGVSYSDVRTALTADRISADDVSAVAHLQPGSSLDFMTSQPIATTTPFPPAPRIRDNNGTDNNNVLNVSRANAKALGLVPGADLAIDASITFSSIFTFDFDRSNGLTAFDFVGVAVHELGHAMGFVSGADTVDATSGSGLDAPVDLDTFRVLSVLDLFRYSDDSLAQTVPGQPVGSGVLDIAAGGTGSAAPYLSLDAGATVLGLMSNGAANGNDQASHWLDDLGIGIMDPTFASGELGVISILDIRAFDAIGYDLLAIPEPSAFFFGGLVCSVLGINFARKRIFGLSSREPCS